MLKRRRAGAARTAAKWAGLAAVGLALAVVLFALSPLAVSSLRQVYLDNIAMPWMLAAFVLVATLFSSQEGPDWIVTVGAISPQGNRYSGSGKPAKVAAPGLSYPAAGGPNVNGQAQFSGTSNAAPVRPRSTRGWTPTATWSGVESWR
jgi:hypothetical protein